MISAKEYLKLSDRELSSITGGAPLSRMALRSMIPVDICLPDNRNIPITLDLNDKIGAINSRIRYMVHISWRNLCACVLVCNGMSLSDDSTVEDYILPNSKIYVEDSI
jgi:hypothetical protein